MMCVHGCRFLAVPEARWRMLFGAYLGAVKKLERAGAAPDAGQQPGFPLAPAAAATGPSPPGPIGLAEVDLAELQLLRAEQARMKAQYERMAAKLADMEAALGGAQQAAAGSDGSGSSEQGTRGHEVEVDTAVSVSVRGKV